MKIPKVSMGPDVEYLLSFLTDEFRDLKSVRIHALAPSGTMKSIDLPQDYDPNENQVHLNRGVRIRAGARDYFFPADWCKPENRSFLMEQVDEIREYLAKDLF
jgi:hypothetical protein